MSKLLDYHKTPCKAIYMVFEDDKGLFAVEMYHGCCECTDECMEKCALSEWYKGQNYMSDLLGIADNRVYHLSVSD